MDRPMEHQLYTKTMNTTLQLSEHQFAAQLTPQIVRTFQIIHAALMTGATMLLFVVALLHSQASSGSSADASLLDLLSIVNAVFTVTAFGASRIVFEKMFNVGTALNNATDPYLAAIAMIRSAVLVRSVILEGAAMFGLVVCMIAATGGFTHTDPIYLLNTASYVLFIAFGMMTFPTKDSLTSIFRTQILQQ